ncbi:hypothetical protein BS78_05G254700 [Paspalum vaginatum]|nr:hypothetical protein BS78_05G254700 [Paspalum vaginatum]
MRYDRDCHRWIHCQLLTTTVMALASHPWPLPVRLSLAMEGHLVAQTMDAQMIFRLYFIWAIAHTCRFRSVEFDVTANYSVRSMQWTCVMFKGWSFRILRLFH